MQTASTSTKLTIKTLRYTYEVKYANAVRARIAFNSAKGTADEASTRRTYELAKRQERYAKNRLTRAITEELSYHGYHSYHDFLAHAGYDV